MKVDIEELKSFLDSDRRIEESFSFLTARLEPYTSHFKFIVGQLLEDERWVQYLTLLLIFAPVVADDKPSAKSVLSSFSAIFRMLVLWEGYEIDPSIWPKQAAEIREYIREFVSGPNEVLEEGDRFNQIMESVYARMKELREDPKYAQIFVDHDSNLP